MKSFWDAKVLEELCSIALCCPSSEFSEFLLQLSTLHAILVAEVSLHIESLLLLHVLPEWLVSHEDGVHNRILVVFEVVLLKNGETLSRSHLYSALVGL